MYNSSNTKEKLLENPQNQQNQHLLNRQIKATRILLLGQDGEKLGEMAFNDALQKASEQELDLMQVGQNKDIAICKIINYESWIYHENKKKQQQEFKNKAHEVKNMQFRPVIGDNDFQLKMRKIEEFLAKNHKVKIVIKLKSREATMKSVNDALIQKITEGLADKGTLDTKISWSFKEINFIVKPEKKVAAKMKP
jgi:translation initiation factor IF-3